MKRILFLGDSITDFNEYVSYIDAYLNINNLGKFEIYNLGLSSENTTGLTEHEHPFPRPNINDRLNRCLDAVQSDIIFVLYGINDGIYMPFDTDRYQEFQAGYANMVNVLLSTHAEIVLITPPYFDKLSFKGKLYDYTDEPSSRGIYSQYDEVMEKYTEYILENYRDKVTLCIDLHSAMKQYIESKREQNTRYISGDGIHPNAEMAVFMADTILREYFGATDSMAVLLKNAKLTKFIKTTRKYSNMRHYRLKEAVQHSSPYKSPKVSNLALSITRKRYEKALALINK